MAVRLEKFSASNFWTRGEQLHALVQDQKEWVGEALPKVVERYRDPMHARYNYLRLARGDAKKVMSLVILDDAKGAPVGTASMAPRQKIVSPDNSKLLASGTDVDYWLRKDATAKDHHDVGRLLIEAAGINYPTEVHQHNTIIGGGFGAISAELAESSHWENSVFVTALPTTDNRPIGLIEYEGMECITNEPTVLHSPGPQELEIVKGGVPLELYAHSFPLQR